MATVYKTPGVYVEEIPKLPPSVAQVETAIPAFVGYTEKAERNGEPLISTPTRISSMVEFIRYYGGAKVPDTINVTIDRDNNYSFVEMEIDAGQRYYMYDSMRLFFDNGGGDCYVVSVGLYKDANGEPSIVVQGDENDPVNSRGLRVGVKALEKYDEPTIILFPDAALFEEEDDFYSLQQMAITQCAKLQDRVAVLDLYELAANSVNEAVDKFRNRIGINNLKYAAAYTPWLYTTYTKEVNFEQFLGSIKDGAENPVDLLTLTADSTLNGIVADVKTAVEDKKNVSKLINNICKTDDTGTIITADVPLVAPTMRDRYKVFADALKVAATDAAIKDAYNILLKFVRNAGLHLQGWKTAFSSVSLTNDITAYAVSQDLWRGGMQALIKIEKNKDGGTISEMAAANVDALYSTADTGWLGGAASTVINDADNNGTPDDGKDYGDSDIPANKKMIALKIANDISAAFERIALFADTVVTSSSTYKKNVQDTLYEKHTIIGNIVKGIKKEMSILPPSAAMAGIYARVDNARGVWKAPANESINSVSAPVDQIDADQQQNLNVDAVAGKSINAIRAFTGKGTLVWGARTLAGNDNEWRYISVRRFFNMVEESCKKSTEPFVFESNDANTWIKVQGMIENFLTVLWRQGALQGAKPEHAFYVSIGLGKTMTALDILEGRMIVEIGMAVVRPAEFIILQFSHKMAES